MFALPNYTLSPDCGYTLTYTAGLSGGNALPSFITFSSSNQEFSIYTSDNSMVNTYTIQVTATANDPAVTDDKTLLITLTVTKANSMPSFSSAPVDQSLY